jgi:hypothetical protein
MIADNRLAPLPNPLETDNVEKVKKCIGSVLTRYRNILKTKVISSLKPGCAYQKLGDLILNLLGDASYIQTTLSLAVRMAIIVSIQNIYSFW